MENYVIALDEGTTSVRSVLIDGQGDVVASASRPIEQLYPHPGWVESVPVQMLEASLNSLKDLVSARNLSSANVSSIGITNQRETTLVWDRQTGKPLCNAIVWQCRRTASLVDALCSSPEVNQAIREKTGLVPDAYFSASKIKWILDAIDGAQDLANQGRLAFGTVDTWLIWHLTGGKVHATDFTNASRTMLYDIHRLCWDADLCELFGIPQSMLPAVLPSSGHFGVIAEGLPLAGVPITGVAGDQQSALFGQCCFDEGQAKNTYGTGCFLLMNTGRIAPASPQGLITTIAATGPGAEMEYALEGSVFMGGALIQWLRDSLGIISKVEDSEALALSVDSAEGVYVVPAFTGLGAPYWDAEARGAIVGLSRGIERAHIVRAALEALAFQVYDLVKAMEADSSLALKVLNVDGGASANNFLLQFQADILGKPLRRPQNVETTATGAAYLAGLATGFWGSLDDLRSLRESDSIYLPEVDSERQWARLEGWHEALHRILTTG